LPRGRKGITPHILNLDTSWRWVVNFTPWSLDSKGKKPWYTLTVRLGRPQSLSGHYEEDKDLLERGIETQVVWSKAYSVYLLHCAGFIPPYKLWGCEVVSQNLHRWSKENHTEPQSCWSVFTLRFDSPSSYATGSAGTCWPQNSVCNSFMWSVMDKQCNCLNLPHRTESLKVLSWSINYPWPLEPKDDQKGSLLEHIPSNMNLVYVLLSTLLRYALIWILSVSQAVLFSLGLWCL